MTLPTLSMGKLKLQEPRFVPCFSTSKWWDGGSNLDLLDSDVCAKCFNRGNGFSEN